MADASSRRLTGSAPISPELRSWVEEFIDIHLIDGYGSTEDGVVLVDGQIQRPPVIDYKLVDVPDLGYFGTDRPHPRGELLVKSTDVIPGYYKRPEVTAELFDADGWYHTGDVMAEIGPDQLAYVDRRNNVLKLSQGEFVTVSKLEAAYGGHPSVRQIFVYGNSARSYLLAVIVPTDDALASVGGDVAAVKPLLSEALQSVAREAGLQSYEIPRDFLVETTPFTLENGLLTGIRKLARPQLKEHYGPELEQLYVDLADGQADVLRSLRTGRREPAGPRDGQPGRRRAARCRLGRRGTRCGVHRSRWRLVVGVDLCQSAARHLRRRRAGRRDRQPGQRPGIHRRLHRRAARRWRQAAHLRRRARPRRDRGARPRSDVGQVPRRRDPGRRTVAAGSEPARCAPCCSPGRPGSSAATSRCSGSSGWIWSTAR